jgi:hypothetical protein
MEVGAVDHRVDPVAAVGAAPRGRAVGLIGRRFVGDLDVAAVGHRPVGVDVVEPSRGFGRHPEEPGVPMAVDELVTWMRHPRGGEGLVADPVGPRGACLSREPNLEGIHGPSPSKRSPIHTGTHHQEMKATHRAGNPVPWYGRGHVARISAPRSGTRSRLAISSICQRPASRM